MKTKFLIVALCVTGCIFAQQSSEKQLQASSTDNHKQDKLVKRNRNAGITFIKDQIYQDDKVIGGMQVAQNTERGQIVRTFTIFFTDGSKIAEAKSYGNKLHEWNIITVKDNHTHVITATSNNDAIDVIKYLINGYYL